MNEEEDLRKMWSTFNESKWLIANMGGGEGRDAIERRPEGYTCENDLFVCPTIIYWKFMRKV